MKKHLLILLLILCNQRDANAQGLIENIELIKDSVAQFLTSEYQASNPDKVDIKIGNLDSRLRLEKCNQPLSYILQDKIGNGGNVSVQVSCKSGENWSILVPAQAKVFRQVAVAARTLQRGQQINETDLNYQSLDMSQYRQGFAVNKEEIVGKEVRYNINKGDAFRSSALDSPLAIKRGDEVSIEAQSGSIKVLTNGTAVSDGRIGQQIRIKNNHSERIVNARVVSSGKVQTIL